MHPFETNVSNDSDLVYYTLPFGLIIVDYGVFFFSETIRCAKMFLVQSTFIHLMLPSLALTYSSLTHVASFLWSQQGRAQLNTDLLLKLAGQAGVSPPILTPL